MKKYQVFKFEKDYVGVYYFEDLKPATEMFTIFTEEAIRERERDIKITEKDMPLRTRENDIQLGRIKKGAKAPFLKLFDRFAVDLGQPQEKRLKERFSGQLVSTEK